MSEEVLVRYLKDFHNALYKLALSVESLRAVDDLLGGFRELPPPVIDSLEDAIDLLEKYEKEINMSNCPTIDRVELTRRKFAKNRVDYKVKATEEKSVGYKVKPTENDDDWDGIHCPSCGKKLRHEAGCIICECGWSKC